MNLTLGDVPVVGRESRTGLESGRLHSELPVLDPSAKMPWWKLGVSRKKAARPMRADASAESCARRLGSRED